MICLCATTRRAARLLTQRYEEALLPANLTPAQFELLATLAQRSTTSQSALAEALVLDQTTLSRNLKTLLARTLVDRAPSPRDRRQTTYTLTPAGQQALAQAMPLWKSAHEHMRRRLDDKWQPTLTALTQLSAVAARTEASRSATLQ